MGGMAAQIPIKNDEVGDWLLDVEEIGVERQCFTGGERQGAVPGSSGQRKGGNGRS